MLWPPSIRVSRQDVASQDRVPHLREAKVGLVGIARSATSEAGRVSGSLRKSGSRVARIPTLTARRWGTRIGAAFGNEAGVTLVELVVVVSIIAILATAAVPVTRWQVKRTKERELRAALWEMRGAIDRYKDAAERGAFQTKVDSFNYPPDLNTLVDGVDVQDKKVRFLRRIPRDPMTNSTEWQLRAMQDDADSTSWGGQNVFDVHSKSQGTALDGTKYSEW
jgi:general secretion pathway protein G